MGERLELIVKDVVYPGKALARRDDGKVVFIDEGIDGEKVIAEIANTHKSYDEAILLQVLEPSPYRIDPKCPHYRYCSVYQIMDYGYQVRIKLRQLANMMKGIYTQKIESILPENRFYYRNKAVFHLDFDRKAFGYKDRVGQVVDVTSCHLLMPVLNRVWEKMREMLSSLKKDIGVRDITLRTNRREEVLVIWHTESDEIGERELQSLKEVSEACEEIVGVCKGEGNSFKCLMGQDYLDEIIGGRQYRFHGSSFFQINYEMMEKVISILRREILEEDSRVILDLFCGVGVLGLSLADIVRWVYGVEIDPACEKSLFVNARNNPFGNFSYKIASSSYVVWEIFEDREMKRKIDTVIVDPPRKGLTRSVREFLRKNGRVKTIFYLSCDPMTLRRDLLHLKSTYKVKKMYFFDFFPQTYHIETLTILLRRR